MNSADGRCCDRDGSGAVLGAELAEDLLDMLSAEFLLPAGQQAQGPRNHAVRSLEGAFSNGVAAGSRQENAKRLSSDDCRRRRDCSGYPVLALRYPRSMERIAGRSGLRSANRTRLVRQVATRCWKSRCVFRIHAMPASRPRGRPSLPRSFAEIRPGFATSVKGGPTRWKGRRTWPNW